MVKETIVSRKVVSWWKYNPLQQKPTSLDPVVPWSWYWYYGPDPASGCSYGQYHDNDYDFDMLSAKKNVVYSPATGKPLAFIDDIPEEEINEYFTKVTSSRAFKTKCNSCKAELISDYQLEDAEKIHCCGCGEEIETSEEATKQIMGKKTMTVRSTNLRKAIRANILKKRDTDAARIKADDEQAKKEDDELVSLDSIMEAMDSIEDEALEDDALGSEEEMVEEMPVEEEMVEEMPEEMPLEEKPLEGDDEEYYDLDMVLSMINKKQRLLKNRKVKADDKENEKEKTDGAELEEKKEEKVEEKKDECKLEEKKEEKKEEKTEEKKDECKLEEKEDEMAKPADKEPNLTSEENPPVLAPVDMEAMKFEPLASLEAFASVRKEDVDMALYNEDTENPIWNVTVAGVPTARIQLKHQMHPEEIKAVFCSDDYAKDLIIHCEKSGFVPTMNKVKAEFWSNYTSNKKIATRFEKEAKASFDMERKKLLATFKQDFRNCIQIVSAGMAKNFYPDMGNPLKEQMFANLRTVGLPEQTAISCVEKSFAEGSAPYFDSLFEKAEEYMSLSSDARKEIAAAISQGSAIEQKVSSELENLSPATLSERLAQASVVASMASGSSMRVNSNLVMDTNEYKQQLKSVWSK